MMDRPRLRFSVRALAIVVTLVCAYFGAWEATKKYGVPVINKYSNSDRYNYAIGENASSPMPFVVGIDETRRLIGYEFRYYYIWCCGSVIELPIVTSSSRTFHRGGLWLFHYEVMTPRRFSHIQ